MKRMELPSAVEVAVATARVDPRAITVTTTEMRVAATMICLVKILSHYRCLRWKMIIEKRTRGLSRAARLRRLPPGWSPSSFV
jgi:hypothetical protein